MSLQSEMLDSMMDEFAIMDKISGSSDGMGGIGYHYVEGAHFWGIFDITNSINEETAKAQGVTGIYDGQISRDITLEFPTVIKRLKDGKTLRITSGEGSDTPPTSALDMRFVRAEEYKIPNE